MTEPAFEAQELREFRRLLEDARERLLADARTGESGSATVELDQTRVGRVSRMDALQGQAMSQASQERRRQALRQVQAALARLETGDYGECASCGEPIDRRRLRHNPAAPLCIDCANAAESG